MVLLRQRNGALQGVPPFPFFIPYDTINLNRYYRKVYIR